MKSNKGSVLAASLMLFGGIAIILVFTGIGLFQQITAGVFHNIKNDLYMVNRNVLLSLQRDMIGEDQYDFYEKEVKGLVEEEIKRLWSTDVSKDTEYGIIERVDVLDAKVINKKNELEIESILKIQLRPVVFKKLFKDKLVFNTKEVTKVKKMRSWYDEEE